MSKEAQLLLEKILLLPHEERAALIVGAMESFAPIAQEITTAQNDEALARAEAYREGDIPTHSEDEAFALIASDS